MTKLLIIAASLSITASAAYACDIHPVDAHASKVVDDTTVASVTSDEAQKMSTPSSAATASTVVLEDETAAPANAE
jgi:hypothetical protein